MDIKGQSDKMRRFRDQMGWKNKEIAKQKKLLQQTEKERNEAVKQCQVLRQRDKELTPRRQGLFESTGSLQGPLAQLRGRVEELNRYRTQQEKYP